MKIKWWITSFLLITLFQTNAQDFKTVGFLPYYRFATADQIEFEKLTHLNIAFANPDMEGNLSIGGQDIYPIVQKAQQAGNEVFLSLAGGALTNAWEAAWEQLTKPAFRSAFIHKIINYTKSFNMQGIDMDLEWSHVDENYSGFVIELRDSVDQHNLQLTASLPGTYRYPEISDEALAVFDWINMMVYDLTGTWAPNSPGPHSPFSFAVSSLNYWQAQGIAKEKLSMGLPFYGYNFNDPNDVYALTYYSIVERNPNNAFNDQDGMIYYNGLNTIEAKTNYAIDENLIGVMIWEVAQDHFGEFSLLTRIHETIQMSTVGTDEHLILNEKLAYPNPFQEYIHLNENEYDKITLANLQGKILFHTNEALERINTNSLASGMYILQVQKGKFHYTQKLIKH